MKLLIGVLVGVAVLAALVEAIRRPKKWDGDPERYYLKPSLFSPAERSFLGVLESLYDAETRIYAKVRLADIFGVKKGEGWQRAFNQISAKHIDFLLARASDGAPFLGIELDDSSHDGESRKRQDAFEDAVFLASGLPLLRVKVRKSYDPNEVCRQIEVALAASSKG